MPFRTVSSLTALEMSGSDSKAFPDADFTDDSSKDDTKSSRRGLITMIITNPQNHKIVQRAKYIISKCSEMGTEGERELPPFSASELPFHELRELGGGDVRVRVSLMQERREFLAVKLVERDEVGFVKRLDS